MNIKKTKTEDRQQRKADRRKGKRERSEDVDHVSLDESLYLDNDVKDLMTMEEIKNEVKIFMII